MRKQSDLLWRIGAAILSGALTALATLLEPYWWAAWLAPIPLLIAAFRSCCAPAGLQAKTRNVAAENVSAIVFKTLEGNTERQKNPHPPRSLAFVAWIAARLGGWNCYYKPPGPKTMRTGRNRLAAILEGYVIATQGKDPWIP